MTTRVPDIADEVTATIAGREVEAVVVDQRETVGIEGLGTEVDVATATGARWTVDATEVDIR